MRLIFTGIDPGSICDSSITEKSDVISWVEEEHEIILDKEFAFQNIYTQIGHLRKLPNINMEDFMPHRHSTAPIDYPKSLTNCYKNGLNKILFLAE